MNKAQAMKKAHSAAYRILQNVIDSGDIHDYAEEQAKRVGDAERIIEAFDLIVQRHFEAGRGRE